MDINLPFDPQPDEPCDPAGLFPDGFFNTDPPASLIQEHDNPAFRHPVSNNRLKLDLKNFVRDHVGDPLPFLAESVANFIANDHIRGKAFADLAVTGRANYSRFRALRPREDQTLVEMTRARLAQTGAAPNDDMIRRNLAQALNRAYRVAWALQGYGDRAGLEYICVCAEIDSPHRPVNVPGPKLHGSALPQFDLAVTVQPTPNNPSPLVVNTRFIVAGNDQTLDSAINVEAEVASRRLPPEPSPQFPAGKGIILGIHGHSSRAEELLSVAPELVSSGYMVLLMDLPSQGYASVIDTAFIGPLPKADDVEAAATSGPFSALEFFEQFIVDFVLALEAKTGVKITRLIRGVIGGSLGGNMGLRLSQRANMEFPWLYNIVAWSPASTWGLSWARAATDYIDVKKGIAVIGTSNRYNEVEDDEARYNHFYRVFGYYQLLEGVQSDRWYRDDWQPCKENMVQGARFEIEERYSVFWRKWHWRLALEQLVFMHYEPATSGGHPRFKNIQSRVLLGAGELDNVTPEKLWENTRKMATNMINTPGTTLWVNHTRHSIDAERPKILARAITEFLSPPRPDVETEFLWTGWQDNGSPTLVGDSLTTAVNENGTVEVFAIAQNSAKIFRSKQLVLNGGEFGPWQEITAGIPSQVRFAGRLAVAPLEDGRLRLYARRSDENWMVHLTQTAPNGDWVATDLGNQFRQLIGGIQAGAAAGVRVGSHQHFTDLRIIEDPIRLHLVAATKLDGITHIRGQRSSDYPDGYWDPGHDIGTNVRFDRTPVFARNHDGHLELINVDPTGKVWHIWEESADHWITNWDRLSGGVLFGSVAVGLNSDGRLEVFGIGGDGQLWHTQQAAINDGWSNWESLGGQLVVGSTPAVALNAWGRLQVFVRWSDNSIRYRRQRIDSYSSWEEWVNLGGMSGSDPIVAQNVNGKIILMVLGADHVLRFRHFVGVIGPIDVTPFIPHPR